MCFRILGKQVVMLRKPKAIPETELSREGEMSTVHRTEQEELSGCGTQLCTVRDP